MAADSSEAISDQSDEVVIGLVADPDLPAALADRLRASLPAQLGERAGPDRTWRVEVVQDPFEWMYPDYRGLLGKARQHVHGTRWHIAICLTDLPMRRGTETVAARVDERDRVAVVSLPALGGLWLRRRLSALLVPLVRHLAPRAVGEHPASGLPALLPSGTYRAVSSDPAAESTVDVVWRGRMVSLRLVAGMVRANRPWQLVLGLSTALASATTGMAFGVLYSTIWALATVLGPLRWVAIVTCSIGALATWVIAGHHLWERGERRTGGRDPDVRLRNASTVATVAVGTVAFFVCLFVIALAAVVIVVPPGYLADNLGRAATPHHYLTIALMASVLGMIAGAVGSGLEDDTSVRRATYSHREHERRQRARHETEHGGTPVEQFRR